MGTFHEVSASKTKQLQQVRAKRPKCKGARLFDCNSLHLQPHGRQAPALNIRRSRDCFGLPVQSSQRGLTLTKGSTEIQSTPRLDDVEH
jgi:hypothetical protein